MKTISRATGKSQPNAETKALVLGTKNETKTVNKATTQGDIPLLKPVKSALSQDDREHIDQLETSIDAAPLHSFRAILELETYKDGTSMAGALAISPRTLARLRRSRTIPFTRIGRLVRYNPAAVSAALAEYEVKSRHSIAGRRSR